MNVIIGRTDFVNGASQIPARPADVAKQLFLDVDGNPWLASFRTENKVQQDIG